MDEKMVLKFDIQSDWASGMEDVSAIIKQAEEKHPDMELHIEVHFGY